MRIFYSLVILLLDGCSSGKKHGVIASFDPYHYEEEKVGIYSK